MLSPYLIWIKLALVVVGIGVLVGVGWSVKSAYSERAALRLSEKAAKESLSLVLDQRASEIKLQGAIADAIKNIRIQSNNYISTVDNAPPDTTPDGSIVQLIAGGMPRSVPGMPTLSVYSASRRASDSAPR